MKTIVKTGKKIAMKKEAIKIDGAKIGLLSGMGPLAGSDVLHRILQYAAEEYGAVEDNEYPDITLLSHGIDGFDAEGTLRPNFATELGAMVEEVGLGNPSVIGIACNTAHICFDEIMQAAKVPIIHLPKTVAQEAAKYDGKFLLLCSHTTKKSGMYHTALQEAGVTFAELTEEEQDELDVVISLVMAFKLPEAAAKIATIIQPYHDEVDGYIVGCTELPIAFAGLSLDTKICIDSNMVLAKVLTDHCYQKIQQAEPPFQKVPAQPKSKVKQEVYALLESGMLSYGELMSVPVKAAGEPMVTLPLSKYLYATPIDPSMKQFTGEHIFVRQSVADKLIQASELLQMYAPGHALEVVYGYRALSTQKKLFANVEMQLADKLDGDALREACNRMVATPETAGHPAGAAVDIQITYKHKPLNMGTKIWEFRPDTYVFSPFINAEAWANRQLLRKVMMAAGFVPFDGEWWHFSYGDREWAAYYKKPHAIYEQIEFRAEVAQA